jgi:ABC-type dipeptide/oligopeptide/nickel transport system permease subunit
MNLMHDAAVAPPVVPSAGLSSASRRRRTARWVGVLFRSQASIFGAIMLTLLIGAAIWPPGLLPHDPFEADIGQRFVPPVWQSGGETAHVLGTDALGRDMLSTIIHGARFSLALVAMAAVLSLVLGVAAGLAAGYFRGWVDALLMRLADVQLAFPVVVLVIAAVAVVGPSFVNLVLVLGIEGWARFARIVRGNVLSLREKDFVEAARAIGGRAPRIMLRHLLPNTATSVVIFLTFDFARLLLLESALSFLGLGVQPPTPSWGAMIADGRQYLFEAWWNAALPGLAIVLAVLSFNFLGDGLRDALDPLSHLD